MDPSPSQPPSGIEVAPGLYLPESALYFSYSRASGPGGQNVNKVSTKATLRLPLATLEPLIGPAATHRLADAAGPSHLTAAGDLLLTSDQSRSQSANREACMDRLRELIVTARRVPKVRRATRPTRGSRQRRVESKKRRSDVKRSRGAPRDHD